jgi:hypothetical protein
MYILLFLKQTVQSAFKIIALATELEGYSQIKDINCIKIGCVIFIVLVVSDRNGDDDISMWLYRLHCTYEARLVHYTLVQARKPGRKYSVWAS